MRRFLTITLVVLTSGLVLSLTGCIGGESTASSEEVGSNPTENISSETFVDEGPPLPADGLTIALKYVDYINEENQPILGKQTTKQVVKEINEIYITCGIRFRVEDYLAVIPKDLGLDYSPTSMGDLTPIRESFDEPGKLVVINTGAWNQAGGLGADGANAWTTMPGQDPSGVVLEKAVSSNSPLVAHELGHYLSLDHFNNASNLMNPIIYENTKELSPNQCSAMRESAQTVWTAALR